MSISQDKKAEQLLDEDWPPPKAKTPVGENNRLDILVFSFLGMLGWLGVAVCMYILCWCGREFLRVIWAILVFRPVITLACLGVGLCLCGVYGCVRLLRSLLVWDELADPPRPICPNLIPAAAPSSSPVQLNIPVPPGWAEGRVVPTTQSFGPGGFAGELCGQCGRPMDDKPSYRCKGCEDRICTDCKKTIDHCVLCEDEAEETGELPSLA